MIVVKKQILILAVLFCSSSISYGQKADKSVNLIQNGKDTGYLIHLKEIKETYSPKLSDFAKDFDIIRLETSKDCILGNGTYYITNEYILVEKPKHGVLQFSSKGKFIRTLAKMGQGPAEYLMPNFTVDEEKQILYINDYTKGGYFLSFDLHSGEYLGNIEKAIHGTSTDIRLLSDNILLVQNVTYPQNEQDKCILYYQDLSGRLITKVDYPKDMHFSLQSNSIINQNPPFRYQVRDLDTVFTIHNTSLSPFLVFDYGEPNPPGVNTPGHKSMYLDFETSQGVYFHKFFITTNKVRNGTIGAADYYLLDKNKNKVFSYDSIYIDPIHQSMSSYKSGYIEIQNNGSVYIVFQAIDLIEQAEIALADSQFSDPYRSILEDVISDLDVEDNPVILLGRLK
jgi:hypothetical protein